MHSKLGSEPVLLAFAANYCRNSSYDNIYYLCHVLVHFAVINICHFCAKVRKRHAHVPCKYNTPMGSLTGRGLPSKCVPFILRVGTTQGSRPRWITIGAGPHLECLPLRWIMIGARPRLGIGLGLSLGCR